MKLIINDDYSLASIQQKFNTLFPFLKLEFFYKFNESGLLAQQTVIQQSNKRLGEIRRSNELGIITITPNMSVSDLAQSFEQIYGIGIHVFRKSGKSWLRTVLTDDWSLQKQNAEGAFLSNPIPPEEPMDYHEQE